MQILYYDLQKLLSKFPIIYFSDVLGASLMDALRERPLVNDDPLAKLSPQLLKAAGGKP
jgi:hypothetical protein